MTHADFIRALGGGSEIAKYIAAEIDPSTVPEKLREAVYKWGERNFIPWKWRAHLLPLAKAKGVPLPRGFIPGAAA